MLCISVTVQRRTLLPYDDSRKPDKAESHVANQAATTLSNHVSVAYRSSGSDEPGSVFNGGTRAHRANGRTTRATGTDPSRFTQESISPSLPSSSSTKLSFPRGYMKPTSEFDGPSSEYDEQTERESDWPIAPPSETDLPAGEYIAAFRSAKLGQWFGQNKIRLLFEIVEPRRCGGIHIPLFATLQKQSSPRCKYYAIWVKANGGVPLRGDRMSPRAFRGYWKVRVVWRVPQKGGYPMPQIEELIERFAG